MKYKTSQVKELVTLRSRPTKDGGGSLYLDYIYNGSRKREFLHLYIVPGATKVDAIQNEETMKVANAMKAKRTVELQEGRLSIRHRRKDLKLSEYLGAQIERYEQARKRSYALTLTKIRRWLGEYGKDVALAGVDTEYLLGFVKYMEDNGLAQGTIHTYFANLVTVFNNAIRDDLLDTNPAKKIDRTRLPKKPDSEREYLTLAELKRLAATPCGSPEVKSAFLFACFTGLRLGDVERLCWESVRETEAGSQLELRQQKTKKVAYIPLSANALAQLPEKRRKTGKVFALPSRNSIGETLRALVKRAGISKRITFHCSRHTYATLLLTYGADLYTVSKLMGHTDIATTQIYAKIVDNKKREAVNLIPEL